MKTITIGTGEEFVSSKRNFEIDGNHQIYENPVAYSISDLILYCNLIIYKSSKEGKILTKLIKEKEELDKILLYLHSVLFKNCDTSLLCYLIQEKANDARDHGIAYGKTIKVNEMRQALELD